MSERGGPESTGSDSTRQVLGTAQGAVEAVRTASETVDEELTGIDEKTQTQAGEMAAVVEEVTSLSATTEEITASAEEVASRSEAAAADVESGYEAAQDSLEVMERATDIGGEAADNVAELEAQLDRIEQSLSGINDIADKTNILALNASIEAARSDQGGEGFAVVAEEIKSLAEESQEQADEVETVLAEVREVATETVAQLRTAIDALETGADRVEETMGSLDEVADAVDQTATDVRSVSDATSEQAETTERITHRCETAAERADDIEDDVAAIRSARAEQTDMLREIETALATVKSGTDGTDGRRIETGVPAIDSSDGGLVQGGQSVLQYDGKSAVDRVIGELCARAIAGGQAVSLTPTPTLDRQSLAAAFRRVSDSITVDRALEADRLFVLDAFDTWEAHRNVFDLRRMDLGTANEQTAARRSQPLVIIGNIAGEISVLGEKAARAARYENDESVFETGDTVLNVIDETAVDEVFAAFYVGSADQVVRIQHDGGDQLVELVTTRMGGAGDTRRPADDD